MTCKRIAAILVFLFPLLASGQAFRVGKGVQIVPKATAPTVATGNGVFWVKSTDSNKLHYTDPSGADVAMGIAGSIAGISNSYNGGTVAADQTALIQSGKGGPIIFKANGAATGSLFKAQTSTATVLFDLADNATHIIRSAVADGAAALGLTIDTSTAWSNTGARLLSIKNNNVEKIAVAVDGMLTNAATVGVRSTAADSGTAVAMAIDTSATWVNGGAKNLSFRQNTTEFGYVRESSTANEFQIASRSAYSTAIYGNVSSKLYSSAADGASAVAVVVDTTNAWSNASALLQSWRTNSSEITKLGVNGVLTGVSATSGLDFSAGSGIFKSSSGANTLSGNVTISDTKTLTGSNNGIGTAQTVSWSLQNTTAAAAGAQQYAPVIELVGRGWDSTAASSKTVKWGLQTRPIQTAGNPNADFVWWYSTNAGAYSEVLKLTSTSIMVAGAAPSGTYTPNWTNVTYANSYVDFSATAKTRYYKTVLGDTCLEVNTKSGTNAATITTLPAGNRPATSIASAGATANNAADILFVNLDGTVKFNAGGNTNGFAYICFPSEQ